VPEHFVFPPVFFLKKQTGGKNGRSRRRSVYEILPLGENFFFFPPRGASLGRGPTVDLCIMTFLPCFAGFLPITLPLRARTRVAGRQSQSGKKPKKKKKTQNNQPGRGGRRNVPGPADLGFAGRRSSRKSSSAP